jgi:hypothetical protein
MIKGTNDSDPWTMQYKQVIQYTENGKQKEIQLIIDSSTITFDKKPNLFNVPFIVMVSIPGIAIDLLKDFSVSIGLLELNSAMLSIFVT